MAEYADIEDIQQNTKKKAQEQVVGFLNRTLKGNVTEELWELVRHIFKIYDDAGSQSLREFRDQVKQKRHAPPRAKGQPKPGERRMRPSFLTSSTTTQPQALPALAPAPHDRKSTPSLSNDGNILLAAEPSSSSTEGQSFPSAVETSFGGLRMPQQSSLEIGDQNHSPTHQQMFNADALPPPALPPPLLDNRSTEQQHPQSVYNGLAPWELPASYSPAQAVPNNASTFYPEMAPFFNQQQHQQHPQTYNQYQQQDQFLQPTAPTNHENFDHHLEHRVHPGRRPRNNCQNQGQQPY
jgi:hypothetical protein